jgi:hypothetical protein
MQAWAGAYPLPTQRSRRRWARLLHPNQVGAKTARCCFLSTWLLCIHCISYSRVYRPLPLQCNRQQWWRPPAPRAARRATSPTPTAPASCSRARPRLQLLLPLQQGLPLSAPPDRRRLPQPLTLQALGVPWRRRVVGLRSAPCVLRVTTRPTQTMTTTVWTVSNRSEASCSS